jgi:hypothetical protein
LTRHKKSKKVFKIKTPKTKITLKAVDEEERERWYEALSKIAKGFVDDEGSPSNRHIDHNTNS